jgi:anaerobic selenocysteine-containing dehydrogenase
MATPGITATDEQGAPLRVGAAVPLGGAGDDAVRSGDGAPPRPGLLEWVPTPAVATAPRLDAYSYRLVVRRSLYDGGTLVGASPSLAPLAVQDVLAVHPAELARLGVAPGEMLKVRAGGREAEVGTVADDTLERHVVVLPANPGRARSDDGTAAPSAASLLVEAGASVTDVRLETII